MGCWDIGDFDGSGEFRIRTNEFEKKQQQPILGIRMKPTVVILLLILTYWHLAASACKQNRLIVHRQSFSMQAEED